jgi:hypothetical protein
MASEIGITIQNHGLAISLPINAAFKIYKTDEQTNFIYSNLQPFSVAAGQTLRWAAPLFSFCSFFFFCKDVPT